MRRILIRLFSLLLALSLPAPALAAAKSEAHYEKARKAYFTLLESPAKQKHRDQWEKVLQLFLAAQKADPAHQRAADALYMAGMVTRGLYEVSRVKSDARQAIAYFDRLALEHPGSSLADDGLLQAAQLLEHSLKEPREAFEHYQRIVRIYPDGDMLAPARDGVTRLARHAPREAPAPAAPPTPRVAAPASAPRFEGVRFHSYPEFTRVVLDLSAQTPYSASLLPENPQEGRPARLVVDLGPARVETGEAVEVRDGRIMRVQTAQNRPDLVRVVFELASGQGYQVFTLPDPYRVVVDVSAAAGKTSVVAPLPPAGGGAGRKDAIADLLEQRPAEPSMRLSLPQGETAGGPLRIVIDPGHGGKDPGAIGPRGVMEKDVTLALAKLLAQELRQKLKCEVILTRDSDVYLPLDERTSIANRLGADLFISLHANANKSEQPYGLETYFLNFSKNEKVMELAAKENGTSLREVGDLEMILLDLMANAKLNESSRLAARIQQAMVQDLSRSYRQIKDLGVRQGPFYVLFGATMPSVLVEVAFISNRREEQRLVDKLYQERTARAISNGVQDFLNGYTLMATR